MFKKILIILIILNSTTTICNCQNYRQQFQSTKNPIKTWPELKNVLIHSNINPISYMTTPQVIKYYGYPVETHQVITSDGYKLIMHRIPFGKNNNYNNVKIKNKPIVFLQHGLFASSFEWFMNIKENLLPLKLVDAGYDVWLGNARGNTYSRGHINMTVKNSKFWEFSMNEMGKYDIPAEIDYVLEITKEKNLYYIGFSMGSTMFWIMMSHHPQYNTKIKLMTALAPVVYLNHMLGLPKILTFIERSFKLKNLIQILTNGEFLPPWLTQLYNLFGTKFCSNTLIAETLCTNINFLYAGWDSPQVLINQIPVFYAHTPSPTSIRTTLHILQFIKNGIFQEYDFGRTTNIEKYHKPLPPLYSLKNTIIPTALLYGPNDGVVNPIDVQRLADELPNVILNSPINFTYWNHFDYHLGKDVNFLVNERIMKLLRMY